MPDESVHSTQKVVLGFILGLILSGICFVIAAQLGLPTSKRNCADSRESLRFKQIQRIGYR